MENLCKICKAPLHGRIDKIFCSIQCKNRYHFSLRRDTNKAAKISDKILHRNRSILLELMGKNIRQKKVTRILLDQKKFNYNYVTGYYVNSRNKIYNYVYDFSWMIFSDREILIFRKSSPKSHLP